MCFLLFFLKNIWYCMFCCSLFFSLLFFCWTVI
jgi:hypothetical protein